MTDWVPVREIPQVYTAINPYQPSVAQVGQAHTLSIRYAGFWNRFVAAVRDGILFSLAYQVIERFFTGRVNPTDPFTTTIFEFLAGVIIPWLYGALMESSKLQATIGKRLIGICVTDFEGNRISFLRATGRHFGKYVSGFILGIGFLMAAFAAEKQALRDLWQVASSSRNLAHLDRNVYASSL